MPVYSDILGMNTRNVRYLRLNKGKGRRIADSKLLTKTVLKKKRVPHPQLITIIENYSDMQMFDFLSLKSGFVLKPSEGLGGDGIVVVKKPSMYAGEWITMSGEIVNLESLKVHIGGILEGQFSRNRTPDICIIEERIKIHPKFRKYAHGGTPDVRVIVFNSVPVMAMLRLPTKESNGKANLHQGAIGVGVDLATGITTYAVHNDTLISYIPGTEKKVNGIVIPDWEEILKVAIDAQHASTLNYAGIDLVVDEEKGPLVLEINDQPGLQIQVANRRGLYSRLKRVENLEISGRYKGMQIAQLLFAESFSDKVKINQGQKVLGIYEEVQLFDDHCKKHSVLAKMDTGAYSASIDEGLATKLGLMSKKNVLYKKTVKSALGRQKRPVIEMEFMLKGRKINAMATVVDRSKLNAPILVGQKYLQGYMLDPSKHSSPDEV